MCGIVGIVGKQAVAPLLVDALKRLEYRGYDSAGVATVEGTTLDRRRAEGKLVNLEERLKAFPLAGKVGIGHTRWATHGIPNETNAHPHFSGNVAVVHNGISIVIAPGPQSDRSFARFDNTTSGVPDRAADVQIRTRTDGVEV